MLKWVTLTPTLSLALTNPNPKHILTPNPKPNER